jgi:molybdenum cofactor synthesis domain-containing protein
MPRAAVVVIGDEILTGKFADENGPFLVHRLRSLGCDLRRLAVVSDAIDDIADEVRRASALADHVITTGGVGPTHDDRTFEGVALAFGLTLEPRPELLALLDRHGMERSVTNARMAMVPAGAELVASTGTAYPVIRVRNVWVLPGVPRLMQIKFEAVAAHFAGPQVLTRRLYTDQAEPEIAQLLFDVQDRYPSVAIGSYPRFGGESWRVIVTLESRDPAALEAADRKLRGGLSLVEGPTRP